MACFIELLPTFFRVYSRTYSEPLSYDSLSLSIALEDRDTLMLYRAGSYQNPFGEISYFLISDENLAQQDQGVTISAPDNSMVNLSADYFKNHELILHDSTSLFCKKGIGNQYIVLN